MERLFRLKELGTTFRREVLAGVTTFMTMSYIVFVNPGILSAAGVPFDGAVTATALGAAVISIAMGLFTNRPLAMAAGMGLNAVVTFQIIRVGPGHVPWQVGMAVVFAEGLVILILVLTGLREAVMNAIPLNLKRAIGVGIGIFITVIGMVEGGVIRAAPTTLVALGDFSQKYVWVTLIGVLAICVFMTLKIRGSMLCGMAVAAVAGVVLGVAKLPESVVEMPRFSTFFAPFQTVEGGGIALSRIFTPSLLMALFALMMTDFFDTMGTVVAVGEQAGFLDKEGKVKGIRRILVVDSLGAVTGGLFGSSSVTSYIESSAGIADGGRSGLMPVVTGLLFVASIFFAPLIKMVGGGYAVPNAEAYALLVEGRFAVPDAPSFYVFPITAGALIVVGFLMMQGVKGIPWGDFEESFPAFLTVLGIPLTYNISYGIGLGFISHVVIKLVRGKGRSVHPLMYVISVAFVVTFLEPVIKGWLSSGA